MSEIKKNVRIYLEIRQITEHIEMKEEKDSPSFRQNDIVRRLGIFRASEAIQAGVSQRTLSRMTNAGLLTRLEHGIFLHADFERMEEVEFIQACLRFGPQAVIGGLTALFYYVLAEQVPTQTWVIVPNTEKNMYSKRYKVIRTKHDPNVGVEEHDKWRIVTIERAIVESFVYHTKIGYQTALTAARAALSEKKITEKSLSRTAETLGCWTQLAKSWEAITTK